MKKYSWLCLLAFAGVALDARAETALTVDQFLKGLTSMSAQKCKGRRLSQDYAAQGKKGEARTIALGERNICDCMPAQVAMLRAFLAPDALKQRMTESEFQRVYGPRIIDKCAADQLKATYAEGCSEQFASSVPNSSAYCQCVSRYVSGLPDALIAQLGNETSDYVPRAAAEKKAGRPAPEMPENLRRFASTDASCRK